jgi:CTP:molybdopterin cytidylyltransferase MocA
VTVAAVVLAASTESALSDAAGRPAVRRIVESAWAGGAVPIIVVAADPQGAVAQALDGSPARLIAPASEESGPVGQIVRGIRAAEEQVVETDAVLVWPARLVWADPETVTSLIERHGISEGILLRPIYDGQAGWPALVPLSEVDALAALAADRMPDDLLTDLEAAGVPIQRVDVGDPGVVHDRDTPIDSLPAYQGPPEPAGGPPPEWGIDDAAAEREETALEGPALTPYGQAADPEASDEA